MTRKDFLKGFGALAAGAAVVRTADGKIVMRADEQEAHDRWAAWDAKAPAGLLDSDPFLQVPAANSMGVAFAVKAYATGFAEVADNPELRNAVRFETEGVPMAKIDPRVLQVRMTGLKPSTRYWYRVGAAALTHPVGYWTKPSPIVWSDVYSFTTCGAKSESRFGFISDTHAEWASFVLTVRKLHALKLPVTVWGGDIPPSMIQDEETAVQYLLKPPIDAKMLAVNSPTFFLDGNHDYRGEWNICNPHRVMLPRLEAERSERFRALTRNFAVRQGDIAMIGLETGEDKPDFHPANGGLTRFAKFRSLQTEWLKEQLKRPEIASAPFVVAFCHIPLFDPRPDANPGTILENWADYQGQCAAEWGPVLTAHGVQLVVCGHKHLLQFDPAEGGRAWAQIRGGGPELGYVGWGDNKKPDPTRFPTVIEGRVENGKLVVEAHDVMHDRVALRREFSARKV